MQVTEEGALPPETPTEDSGLIAFGTTAGIWSACATPAPRTRSYGGVHATQGGGDPEHVRFLPMYTDMFVHVHLGVGSSDP